MPPPPPPLLLFSCNSDGLRGRWGGSGPSVVGSCASAPDLVVATSVAALATAGVTVAPYSLPAMRVASGADPVVWVASGARSRAWVPRSHAAAVLSFARALAIVMSPSGATPSLGRVLPCATLQGQQQGASSSVPDVVLVAEAVQVP
jgi:hypothetical protein